MDMNLLLKMVFFMVIVGFLIFVAIVLIERSKPELVVTPGMILYTLKNKTINKRGKKGFTLPLNLLLFVLVIVVVAAIVTVVIGIIFFNWNPLASIFQSKLFAWIPFF
jgi:hypothetical protein